MKRQKYPTDFIVAFFAEVTRADGSQQDDALSEVQTHAKDYLDFGRDEHS